MIEYRLRMRVKMDDELLYVCQRDIPKYCQKHNIERHEIIVVKPSGWFSDNKVEINLYSFDESKIDQARQHMQIFRLAHGW